MSDAVQTPDRWKNIPKQRMIDDCWRCCVAAVLGLPAEDVPHFLEESHKDGNSSMQPMTQLWLNERGFLLIEADRFALSRCWKNKIFPKVPIIAGGPTPRSLKLGQHHAVVMINDEVVYDPHPHESGLTHIATRYMIVPFPPGTLPPDPQP